MLRVLFFQCYLICFQIYTCTCIGLDPKHSVTTLDTTQIQHDQADKHGFEIVGEEIVYSRWRSIVNRRIRQPKDGKIVEYDIVEQKGAGAVIIFAWNSLTKTATLVREYNPGNHKVMTGLAAGIVDTDPDKHGSDFDLAARLELEEECHLAGGKWYNLLDNGAKLMMDKYCSTGIALYLVIDAEKVENPRNLDEEEDIKILDGVSIEEVMKMIKRGEFNLVGCCATMLALHKLRDLGEIP